MPSSISFEQFDNIYKYLEEYGLSGETGVEMPLEGSFSSGDTHIPHYHIITDLNEKKLILVYLNEHYARKETTRPFHDLKWYAAGMAATYIGEVDALFQNVIYTLPPHILAAIEDSTE